MAGQSNRSDATYIMARVWSSSKPLAGRLAMTTDSFTHEIAKSKAIRFFPVDIYLPLIIYDVMMKEIRGWLSWSSEAILPLTEPASRRGNRMPQLISFSSFARKKTLQRANRIPNLASSSQPGFSPFSNRDPKFRIYLSFH